VLVMGKVRSGQQSWCGRIAISAGDVFGYSARNTRSLLRSAMEPDCGGGRGCAAVSEARIERDCLRLDGGTRKGRATTRHNTPEADFRDYGTAAQILRDVGVRKMIYHVGCTPRLANLPGYGLEIGDGSLSSNGKQSAAAK